MTVMLAATAAVLFGIGTYLLLQRKLSRIIIGLGLLTHGANVLLITSGRRGEPPIIGTGATDSFADPLPQALVLTAIVITFGVTALLFALDLGVVGLGLVCIALCASPGLAASGTLFGAMTVRTQARDLLLAVVLFPLLTPTLLCAVAATRELLGGATVSELGDYFQLMGVFDLVFVAGGLSLFGSLIER